jgi:hypothetical protein
MIVEKVMDLYREPGILSDGEISFSALQLNSYLRTYEYVFFFFY